MILGTEAVSHSVDHPPSHKKTCESQKSLSLPGIEGSISPFSNPSGCLSQAATTLHILGTEGNWKLSLKEPVMLYTVAISPNVLPLQGPSWLCMTIMLVPLMLF